MSTSDTKPVLVEVLAFDGCPNAEPALAAVRDAAAKLAVEIDLRPVAVPDLETAERVLFLGSPTIRIEGRDVEPGASGRKDYVLGCRVYRTEQGATGVPAEHWIQQALQQAAGSTA